MEIKKGIGVSPGFAIGPAFVLGAEEYSVFRKEIPEGEVKSEIARFKKAVEDAVRELQAHAARLSRNLAKVAGRILESQGVLLRFEDGAWRLQNFNVPFWRKRWLALLG